MMRINSKRKYSHFCGANKIYTFYRKNIEREEKMISGAE